MALGGNENQRFDFVAEDASGKFLGVQCKTGRLRRGSVIFNAFSSTYHHPANRGSQPYHHGYRGDADLFGVYCLDTRCVYLVPVDVVPTTQVALRVEPTKNNQQAGIRFAADFQVDPPG